MKHLKLFISSIFIVLLSFSGNSQTKYTIFSEEGEITLQEISSLSSREIIKDSITFRDEISGEENIMVFLAKGKSLTFSLKPTITYDWFERIKITPRAIYKYNLEKNEIEKISDLSTFK